MKNVKFTRRNAKFKFTVSGRIFFRAYGFVFSTKQSLMKIEKANYYTPDINILNYTYKQLKTDDKSLSSFLPFSVCTRVLNVSVENATACQGRALLVFQRMEKKNETHT